jgi:hypothetical protein
VIALLLGKAFEQTFKLLFEVRLEANIDPNWIHSKNRFLFSHSLNWKTSPKEVLCRSAAKESRNKNIALHQNFSLIIDLLFLFLKNRFSTPITDNPFQQLTKNSWNFEKLSFTTSMRFRLKNAKVLKIIYSIIGEMVQFSKNFLN